MSYTQYWPFILGTHPGRPALRLPRRHRRRGARWRRASSRRPAVLEVRDVRKIFDGFSAVGGRELHRTRAAAITAIIGPNGAGKTTLFNLITGHLAPDAGRVSLKDATSPASRPTTSAGLGWAARSSAPTSSRKLTVYENVQAALLSHRGRGANFWSPRRALYRDEAEALLALARPRSTRRETSAALSRTATRSSSSSASRWRASRRSCCSTSRPPACRRPRRARPSALIERIAPSAGSPCSSPSTTWRWCSRSRRGSRCCIRAS